MERLNWTVRETVDPTHSSGPSVYVEGIMLHWVVEIVCVYSYLYIGVNLSPEVHGEVKGSVSKCS